MCYFFLFNLSNTLKADAPRSWQIYFQDPATISMEGILNFNNHLTFLLIVIIVFVGWFLFFTIYYFVEYNNRYSSKFVHSKELEIVWTSIPALILLILSIPSFTLLYSMDEVSTPDLSLKVLGHQWFWSYESYDLFESNLKTIYQYDSYMTPTDEINDGKLRLLDVDLPLYLPTRTHIRILITSSDVLHSWAVPSLGVKMDAVPGRLNQISLFIKRKGVFYGQCSEICGINHGFMPIVVKAIPIETYLKFFLIKS